MSRCVPAYRYMSNGLLQMHIGCLFRLPSSVSWFKFRGAVVWNGLICSGLVSRGLFFFQQRLWRYLGGNTAKPRMANICWKWVCANHMFIGVIWMRGLRRWSRNRTMVVDSSGIFFLFLFFRLWPQGFVFRHCSRLKEIRFVQRWSSKMETGRYFADLRKETHIGRASSRSWRHYEWPT